jgi:phage tail P2-like protein
MSRLNSLLPSNSTVHERNLEGAVSRISDVPVTLDVLMNADTIPLPLLPWLAWHLGIDSWNDAWPEQIKRARVKSAIPIARRKGTVAAVEDVVAAFGANIAIREWWETNPRGTPGTFDVVLTVSSRDGNAPTAALVADIVAEIDRVKPLSRHYTFTQGFQMQGSIGLVGAARFATYARLKLTEAW